jgi:hypothetical protein
VSTTESTIDVTIGKYTRTFPPGLSYLISPGRNESPGVASGRSQPTKAWASNTTSNTTMKVLRKVAMAISAFSVQMPRPHHDVNVAYWQFLRNKSPGTEHRPSDADRGRVLRECGIARLPAPARDTLPKRAHQRPDTGSLETQNFDRALFRLANLADQQTPRKSALGLLRNKSP